MDNFLRQDRPTPEGQSGVPNLTTSGSGNDSSADLVPEHSVTSTSSEANLHSEHTSSASSIALRILETVFVQCGVIILRLLFYARIIPLHADEAGGLDAAEQGDASPEHDSQIGSATDLQAPRSLSDQSPSKPETIIQGANIQLRRLAKGIIVVIFRLVLSFISLFVYSFNWLEVQLKPHVGDTIWVAFGIFNFATAAIYYLTIFDGKGTFSPRWTGLLG